MARDYIQPKIPSSWSGDERTYARMLQDVLDDLHQYIPESWLNMALIDKINGKADKADLPKLINYAEAKQDTGVTWIDGKKIYSITQVISVTANVPAVSDTIDDLGALIRVTGCVVTSGGLCYPIGNTDGTNSVNVYKDASGETFKILSTLTGTAYVTVYYYEDEVQPVQETLVYFSDGYVDDVNGNQIGWSANALTRPTPYYNGIASLSHVANDGYMNMYPYVGRTGDTFNAHVCTTNDITVPTNVSKLYVQAAFESYQAQIAFGLISSGNALDATGGVLSTWYTLTNTKALYSVDVPGTLKGATTYKLVVNWRGKDDLSRIARIYKVYFE